MDPDLGRPLAVLVAASVDQEVDSTGVGGPTRIRAGTVADPGTGTVV